MVGIAVRTSEHSLSDPERSSMNALAGIIERIETTVDAETDAMRNNRPIDLTAISHRKRQGLLELSRIIPQISKKLLEGEAKPNLAQLSQKLERNRSALDVQLRAVREVADIIATMIREAESDGTYSGQLGRP